MVDSLGEGAPYVSEIKESSPLRGKIKVGDRVVAIDGEDVSEKEAVDVSSKDCVASVVLV